MDFCVFSTHSGHLIVVVFPLIKIHNQLILLLATSDSKICQNGICHYECKSPLPNSLYTLATILSYNNRILTVFFGLLCPVLATPYIWIPVTTFSCFHESSYTYPDFTLYIYSTIVQIVQLEIVCQA